MEARHVEEAVFKVLMVAAATIVAASLGAVLFIVLAKGLPALTLDMITRLPEGGYYYGKGGGILNAIVGSLYLGLGATAAAFLLSLPLVFYLQREYSGGSRLAYLTRLSLDVMWGVPSIVYGAFGFALMVYLGLRASLLGGMIVLTLVEFPIMARAFHEVIRMAPADLKEASYALGATRFETSVRVIRRYALPGIVTGVLLAFGRGIGDAAAVLFTAGYSDYLPRSLTGPVASLPLAVFFQIGMPFPKVQARAYAAAAILLAIVLLLSLLSRLLARKWESYIAR